MKTLIILLISFSSFAQDSFRYEQDKKNHFAACEILSLMTGLAAASDGHEINNAKRGIIVGASVGLGVGLLKETYDYVRGGQFSGYDLCYDILGTMTGTSITYAIVKISEAHRRHKAKLKL